MLLVSNAEEWQIHSEMTALACVADIQGTIKNLLCFFFSPLLLFGSNHGQPSSDQPSVTDPWGNISLQHLAG